MKDTLVIHHSADSSTGNQYAKTFSYHNSGAGGKWPAGHGIQYAFFIERSGEVIQGKTEDATTWHAGKWLMNVRSIAICLGGNFTKEKPTNKQLDSMYRLVTQLQLKYNIPDSRILKHSDVRATACPAFDVKGEIRKRRLADRLKVAKDALPHSSGIRYNILVRLIARLTQLIS
jgi:hypothetical protein